jgi:hypothetical protein
MDPLANEAKNIERLFTTVNAPNEIGMREIEKLYPLCWKIDEHFLNVSIFANEIM